MKAITTNDRCFATTECAESLNTDGKEREELDIAEVREALNFNIVKKQSYDADGRKIPGQFHLVREDTNHFIPSVGVGERFAPVQHLSIFDYVTNEIMPKVPGMKLEAAGTLHGCGTGLIVANIGDAYRIDGDDSPNNMRMFVSNPCNGYGSIILGFTAVRLWCQNQIPAAIRQTTTEGFKVRHTTNAEFYCEKTLNTIYASILLAKEIRAKSEGMAKVNVNATFLNRVMNAIYPLSENFGEHGKTMREKHMSEVMAQFEGGETAQSIKGDTAWKLFNAFTYPIFNPKKINKNTDKAQIVYSGALGDRSKKVKHIFDVIYNETMMAA